MKRWLLALPLAAVMAALVPADPPTATDPSKDYPITAQSGAWVIVAATYTGPDAANLTRQLVVYLRGLKLPAYACNFADKKRAEMKADEARWKQEYPERPFKKWKIDDTYGVLIGGFQDMDSARDYMLKVLKNKDAKLPPLKLADGKSAYDKLVYYEKGPNGELQAKQAALSPFLNSFVSRNPAATAAGKTVDPFLKELNALEDYSLLNCPAPWTMAVQQLGGGKTYVPRDKKEETPTLLSGFRNALLGSDKPNGEAALNGAAAQAHEMARVLRKLGFDAYVLHTRHSSIVTIGGFNSAADPAMIKTAERLASLKLDQLHLLRNFYSCEVPRP